MTANRAHPNENELRATDRERERVVELLGKAAGDGRLELSEYSERTAIAYRAQTKGELAEVTDDLVPSAPRLDTEGNHAYPDPKHLAGEHISASFASTVKTGRWMVPENLRAKALFGSCEIELQEAVLHHPITVIDASVWFGAVIITVPRGVEVQLSGSVAFGDKTSNVDGARTPGAPVVQVRCRVRFGQVVINPVEP